VGWEDGPAAFSETARYVEESRTHVASELAALEARVRAASVAVISRQVDGVPHQAIAELSAAFDLIVMGTHGRTGLSHLFVGSVAERVLRHARCPVVTVPSART
jgi:nucleotide-binding universal stress UspA family protein